MIKLEKAEQPNEFIICFSEKLRTVKNVIEFALDSNGWILLRTKDSEVLIQKEKVNWIELKQL